MFLELSIEKRIAFLMSAHPRLGAESCGSWQKFASDNFCFDDVLTIILNAADIRPGIVRQMSKREIFIVGEGKLQCPHCVAVDSVGNIVVVDCDGVKVFRGKDGVLLKSMGHRGSNITELHLPWGVAVDQDDSIIAANVREDNIVVFDRDGNVRRTVGRSGSGEGKLKHPYGVAVDGEGNIIVADYDNNRLQLFGRDGRFLRAIGKKGSGEGELQQPWGVAVDSHGVIVVAESLGRRVAMFKNDGTFIRSIRKWGSEGFTLGRPRGLAIDMQGNVVVADWEMHKILIFR
eukprot:763573-Hanusia_phi.AAC.3